MPANKVQADYDELEKIAGEFADESANMQQLTSQIMNLVGELESGGWIGRGADAFYGEIHDLLEPGLGRLIRGLEDGSNSIKQISNMLSQAENDAGSLFNRSR